MHFRRCTGDKNAQNLWKSLQGFIFFFLFPEREFCGSKKQNNITSEHSHPHSDCFPCVAPGRFLSKSSFHENTLLRRPVGREGTSGEGCGGCNTKSGHRTGSQNRRDEVEDAFVDEEEKSTKRAFVPVIVYRVL